MPRTSRFVLPDVVHHVVARGVNRQRIFRSGYDKGKYLKRFAKIAEEERVLVHGFCLMDNHVHWLLTPTNPAGLARLFQRVHTWWALVFNRKSERTGHLFESRYHSSALSESHYWSALRYVELNPKKARLIEKPEDWEFSSARAHITGNGDKRIGLVPVVTRRKFTSADWREFLHSSPDSLVENDLRNAARTNRPCGDPAWIAGLEKTHYRRLTRSLPGRPTPNTLLSLKAS